MLLSQEYTPTGAMCALSAELPLRTIMTFVPGLLLRTKSQSMALLKPGSEHLYPRLMLPSKTVQKPGM